MKRKIGGLHYVSRNQYLELTLQSGVYLMISAKRFHVVIKVLEILHITISIHQLYILTNVLLEERHEFMIFGKSNFIMKCRNNVCTSGNSSISVSRSMHQAYNPTLYF